MKNKIMILTIIILTFVVILIPLKGSYAFYSDNKDLEIINTKVGDWNTLLGYLRMNDKNNNLSSTIQGDMYRYQGTGDVANWICFGTIENCGTNDELIDQYMYRIIGITEEGQLKLLKETFIKEDETNTFEWNLKYKISDCLGDTCEWPNVDLYKRLNGKISNGNPIFIDSSEYEYMSENDNWYNLIGNYNWMYGDTNTATNSIRFYGNEMYAIETGKTAAKRIWPDEETQTTCSSDNPCTEKDYTWSKSINAKIGLMYMHDVTFSYANCSSGNCIDRGNPGSSNNVKNSWIHFQKDGYNTSSTIEWLMTRYGVFETNPTVVGARNVDPWGTIGDFDLNAMYGVRPVFYLNSDVIITKGSGTKENPFIIQN